MKFTELNFGEVKRFLARRGFLVGCFYLGEEQGYCHSNLTHEGMATFKEGFCYYGTR